MSNIALRLGKRNIIFGIAVVVLAVLPLIGVPHQWLLYLFLYFVYLSMANMWNLLAGYSGLLCLCPAAYIGLSGYALILGTWVGIPMYLGIIIGGIVAALFAVLISIPVFRLVGIYFAIGTLVVPEALKYLFYIWRPMGGDLHGGGAGYMVKGDFVIDIVWSYWPACFVGIVSIVVMNFILKSNFGLGLAAIRDNVDSASSSGVNVFRLKFHAFFIAAFITGLAGGVFYFFQGHIEPNSAFNIRWLMTALLATVIGGIGTQDGPIVGTVVVVVLHFLLARYTGISLLIQGVLLFIIISLAPEGIIGFVRKIIS
ncbi:MAG: branched-chain amino acid ABC transporter permease [Deltaproteobacteria bacterium]|nr:branched-chain amino acid ABC transporter permease [Deltaproteobacteria bacterium]